MVICCKELLTSAFLMEVKSNVLHADMKGIIRNLCMGI